MAKKTGSKSEWRRLLKFEQENEKLRKEVSKLRKQARTHFVDELEERSNRVEKGEPARLPVCDTCGNNDIHLIQIDRKDGTFEMKVCKSCQTKSPMKRLKT